MLRRGRRTRITGPYDFPMTDPQPHPLDARAAIARDLVHVLKNELGRGPTKAKVYLHDECVLVLMREGHTRREETMLRAGEGRSVAQGRVEFADIIRDEMVAVVARHTGRRIIGFLSSSQQQPSLLSFVFVFGDSPAAAAEAPAGDDAE